MRFRAVSRLGHNQWVFEDWRFLIFSQVPIGVIPNSELLLPVMKQKGRVTVSNDTIKRNRERLLQLLARATCPFLHNWAIGLHLLDSPSQLTVSTSKSPQLPIVPGVNFRDLCPHLPRYNGDVKQHDARTNTHTHNNNPQYIRRLTLPSRSIAAQDQQATQHGHPASYITKRSEGIHVQVE